MNWAGGCDRRARSLSLSVSVALACASLGCARTHTDAPTVATPPEPPPVATPADPDPPGPCGSPALRFADYNWIPADSRLATSIMRDDPELADTLRALADPSTTADARLPIYASLDFKLLGLQVASVEHVVRTLELDPAELVELQTADGDVTWLWPTDCPTQVLATRALDRLGVLVRADFDHPGVRLGAGSRERFPFDLVLLRGRALALAPLGRGAIIGPWLAASSRETDGPGAALASIAPAPVRSVLSGPALLHDDTGAPASRKLRATAAGWHDADPPDPHQHPN